MDDFLYIDADYNKIYDSYIDEHEIVTITEKEPLLSKIGTIVAGDSESQFMTFEINRYYDNIDLSNKIIKFNYVYEVRGKIVIRESTIMYSDFACNICYNDEKLRFSWLLPTDAAQKKGKLAVSISFIGYNSDTFEEEGYNLQTKIFELNIEDSIANNNSIEQIATIDWFSDVESRLYKVEQASGEVELNYETLENLPSINGEVLKGDITLEFIDGLASINNIGGVKAIAKTDDMVSPVGIDADGLLWTKATGGSGGGSGADGFSPIVTLTPAEDGSGTTLAIMDKNGLKTSFIKNGEDGKDGTNGTDGNDGSDGVDGNDGVSVIDIEVTEENKLKVELSDGNTKTTTNAIKVNASELINDSLTKGDNATWSVDKIISYVKKTLEDIENGTY